MLLDKVKNAMLIHIRILVGRRTQARAAKIKQTRSLSIESVFFLFPMNERLTSWAPEQNLDPYQRKDHPWDRLQLLSCPLTFARAKDSMLQWSWLFLENLKAFE